ncbi:MAG: hypothetical protein ACTSPB_12630 [Candidatus Thorarchaeota archaeon]
MNGVRDYSPISSSGALKSFQETSIHKDFQAELTVRIDTMRDMLEASEKELETDSHDMIRGAVKVLRQIYYVFKNLEDNALTDKERKT